MGRLAVPRRGVVERVVLVGVARGQGAAVPVDDQGADRERVRGRLRVLGQSDRLQQEHTVVHPTSVLRGRGGGTPV